MTSLGFRRDHDHIAERPKPTVKITPLPTTTSACDTSTKRGGISQCGLPRGMLPTCLYSGLSILIPLLFFYADVDYTQDATRGVVIGLSAVSGLVAILANDCCCWYNMMLFFHVGIEVKVVDVAIDYAYADGTSDEGMGLAIAGAAVVILHLVPFFVSNNVMLLIALAYAGIVVNTAILVFLDSTLLLVVVASALGLLSIVMVVDGICEVKTSMLSIAMRAMRSKTIVTRAPFGL